MIGGLRCLLLYGEDADRRDRFQRLLRGYDHKWALVPTRKSEAELVRLLRENRADGVIFLYHKGQTAVLESLQLIGQSLPLVQRFVVGASEERESLRTLPGMPPIFLPENLMATEVDERLTHAFALQGWIGRPAISQILPRLKSLPVLPATYQQVFEALLDPEFSGEKVASLIGQDPSLTAQLLKVANSAFFGRPQAVRSIPEAVMMLGVIRLRALVMSSQAFCFIDEGVCPHFSPTAEGEHALEVADVSQQLARKVSGDAPLAEAAFTAGLLHDLGKVLIAANLPDAYGALLEPRRERPAEIWRLEQERLGFTHGELGACLLGVWGVPLDFIEAVAWHHEPAKAPGRSRGSLALVHVADCLVRKREPDRECLKAWGLDAIL